jgi:hypothetical protein
LLALVSFAVVLADARPAALLAPASPAVVLADAFPAVLLAPASYAVVLADARPAALLALVSFAVVLADAHPAALLAPRGKTLHVSLLYYRAQGITELPLMPMEIANVSQPNKLLEESEDVLSFLKETAERIRIRSPHERVSRAPKPSLAEKQNAGNTSSAGAGRRSRADLYISTTHTHTPTHAHQHTHTPQTHTHFQSTCTVT